MAPIKIFDSASDYSGAMGKASALPVFFKSLHPLHFLVAQPAIT
jgi:hypothetical protein